MVRLLVRFLDEYQTPCRSGGGQYTSSFPHCHTALDRGFIATLPSRLVSEANPVPRFVEFFREPIMSIRKLSK